MSALGREDSRDPIALVTDNESLPDDYDMAPLLAACQQLGLPVEVCRWDDDDTDWSRFAAVVVRSPWSYTTRLADFFTWCERVTGVTELLNPLNVIRWTLDKRYLRDLAHHGVRTVPTTFIAPDASPNQRRRLIDGATAAHRDASAMVVKPSVGAYSRGVRRFPVQDRGTIHDYVTSLSSSGQHALVQPYFDTVDERGETDLIFFNGDFSHAIRKAPLLRQDTAGEPTQGVRSARIPSPEEIDLAVYALSAAKAHLGLDDPLLYARVDLVHTSTGDPAVLELELCEPSLSLAFHPSSAHTFAAAMATRIGLSRTATHR